MDSTAICKKSFASKLVECAVVSIVTFQLLQGRSQALQTECFVRSAREGEPGEVHCTFPVDVKETKKEIAVKRYDLDIPVGSFNPDGIETVLECDDRNDRNFECHTKSGYKLEGEVSRTLTLRIAAASSRFVGRYVCQILPADPKDLNPCVFQLTHSGPSVAPIHNQGSSTPGNQRSDAATTNNSSPLSTGTVIAISAGTTVAILILAAVCLAIAFWVRRNREKKAAENRNRPATTTDDNRKSNNDGQANLDCDQEQKCMESIGRTLVRSLEERLMTQDLWSIQAPASDLSSVNKAKESRKIQQTVTRDSDNTSQDDRHTSEPSTHLTPDLHDQELCQSLMEGASDAGDFYKKAQQSGLAERVFKQMYNETKSPQKIHEREKLLNPESEVSNY